MLYESASGDLAAWVLAALLVLSCVFLGSRVTRTPLGLALFVFAVFIRVALSALSSYNVILPPDLDRLAFHNQASEMALSEIGLSDIVVGHQVFTIVLALVYHNFGTSLFLGCIVSLIPFVMSLVLLFKCARLLDIAKYEVSLLVFFGLSPGMLLFANFTYREPLQILFMMAATYQGLIYRRTASVRSLLLCAGAFFAFALLHAKFFLVAPLLFLIVFFFPGVRTAPGANSTRGRRLTGSFIAGAAIATLSVFAIFTTMGDNYLVQTLMGGQVSDYLMQMKDMGDVLSARTALPFRLESTNPLEIVVKTPLILFQYMFAPLAPWAVSEPQDLVALVDTVLRTVMLVYALRFSRRAPRTQRGDLVVLLLIYFVFSAIAAMGTAAVGTAIRHQIKVSWILVLLGRPALLRRRREAAVRSASGSLRTMTGDGPFVS